MIRVFNAVTDLMVAKFGINQYSEAVKFIVKSHKTIVEEYTSEEGDIDIYIKQEY